ncbi:MAG: hypothetical protein B6D65_03725 [candidate division Zixibacteria bacterium 4484_93]|nr:MAG: hypothetical protein B6D65_03725 [candidate division Zixibacteria bacterium 4484_93]
MADNPKFIVTPAPHLKGRYSIPKIMYAVVLALIPELVFATYLFGPRALILTLIAVQTIEGLYSGWQNMFWGKIGGCIGETSAALIILTGLILIIVRIVDWRIPVSYIGTVALLGWMLGGETGLFNGNVAFQLFTGGLMLGAFFMATDMVTSPITAKGRWIFGIGAGVLTVLIRRFGGYPEGVSYSILLMNITVPLIDRWTKPRTFGEVKKK